jgi:hypothetical protein
MQILQRELSRVSTAAQLADLQALAPHLVLAFWNTSPLATPSFLTMLHSALPNTAIIGCSTAGQIVADGLCDDSAVLTAIRFERSHIQIAETALAGEADSYAAGARLAPLLPQEELRGVLLLVPGVDSNGSALIEGLSARLPQHVVIFGGLAGDNGLFDRTYLLNSGGVAANKVIAVGFYGKRLQFGMGCRGGWSPFGPVRTVTRAEGTTLFEIDDQPALALYKKYLGARARELPDSALAYPLEILGEKHQSIGLLRMVLGIDEAAQSLQLAGTVVEGAYVRLMHADTDALVDGAENAAIDSLDTLENGLRGDSGLVVMISCAGRRRVMGDRVGEEVMAVSEQLGHSFTLTGFYANGAISPWRGLANSWLHNQTMTMTLITER